MDESEIIARLDQLAAVDDQLDHLRLDLNLRKSELITPEIHEQMDAIDSEVGPLIEAAAYVSDGLAAEIKAAILERKSSVKSTSLNAIYDKGKRTWDSDKLEGYGVAHPEILEFRKPAKPSVSIRELK